MKKYKTLYFIYALFFLLLLSACGEDRSGEYMSRTEEDRWIEEKMRDIYLWYYDMPEASTLKYFAIPEDFFPTLLSKVAQGGKGDKYSYIVTNDTNASTRIVDQKSTYGFDFILYNDLFGKTSNRYARVIFVLPNSPASIAGLKRGHWISRVNNEALTESNYGYLYRGGERQFSISHIEMNKDSTLVWKDTNVIEIEASRPVEDNPFYVDSVYEVKSRKIAYLMYNRFAMGPGDTPEESIYNEQMKRVFSQFKADGFNDLILDFRYNPGGYLSCSQLMASILAPEGALGKTYCSLTYNNYHLNDNYELPLSKEISGGVNLNLNHLYVIVSNLTAFAPEALINCLQPYISNITVIGTKTNGQNVAVQAVPSPYNFTLFPVVATVSNAVGESNYSNGIVPQYILDETLYYDSLYALGDTRERMLKNTISLITTGTMPDAKIEKPATGNRLQPMPQVHSVELRKRYGTILTPEN